MSSTRRGSLEVALDVLRSIDEGAQRTSYIIRKSNISYLAFEKIVNALIEKGLVWVDDFDGRPYYMPTETGHEFATFARSLQANLPHNSELEEPEMPLSF